jgi:membrane protease YdiL (CAAX protease family)
MAADRIELKIFLLTVAAVMTVEAAAFALAHLAKMDRLMLVGVMRLLQTGLILGIAVRLGGGWPGIGLGRPTIVRGIREGLVWSVAFGCCALAVGLMLFWAGINPLTTISSEIPKSVREIVLLIVVGGVIGPVAEEVFFRGICYGFFRKWGIVAAIVLTTAVFVLPHGIKTGIPTPQIIGGIVFAIAYEKGKSLLVPIVIHISGNLALFAISIWF